MILHTIWRLKWIKYCCLWYDIHRKFNDPDADIWLPHLQRVPNYFNEFLLSNFHNCNLKPWVTASYLYPVKSNYGQSWSGLQACVLDNFLFLSQSESLFCMGRRGKRSHSHSTSLETLRSFFTERWSLHPCYLSNVICPSKVRCAPA